MVEFVGAQVEIDSTGKAADVLKRIRVRKSIGDLSRKLFPEFAIQSKESICKLIEVDKPDVGGITAKNNC